jgi:hypothetical protein
VRSRAVVSNHTWGSDSRGSPLERVLEEIDGLVVVRIKKCLDLQAQEAKKCEDFQDTVEVTKRITARDLAHFDL